MGRIKKHKTLEEKAEMHRLASKKYYWNNKLKCDEKQRERNHRNIQNNKSKG